MRRRGVIGLKKTAGMPDNTDIVLDGSRNNQSSLTVPRLRRCFLMVMLTGLSLALTLLIMQIHHSQNLGSISSIAKDVSGAARRTAESGPLLYLSALDNVATLMNIVGDDHQRKSPFDIDILSIGSLNNLELIDTQFSTWANQPSRRLFIAATENDDPDPNCYKNLTMDGALDIIQKCQSRDFYRKLDSVNDLTKSFNNKFSNPTWLKKRNNPTGWMCAQRRPPFALARLLQLYREARDLHGYPLPDYLIVVDDDTLINLPEIEKSLLHIPSMESTTSSSSSSGEFRNKINQEPVIPPSTTPVVFAGCRVRWPIHEVNFTFPFGGYGTFFSRAAVERMITPLYCNETATGFEQEACERIILATNQGGIHIGELPLFQKGMSIGDLMKVFTASGRYCLHSDWATGYFVNFYNVSRHVVDDGVWFNQEHRMDNVKEARLHSIDGSKSEIYRPNKCHSDGSECTSKSLICHRVTPEIMKQIYGSTKKDLLEK